jgi:hypothetical protein
LGLGADVIGLPMPTFLLVTKNLPVTPPMPTMVPNSQLMAPITIDSINFTDNTKELGNSFAV